MTRTCSQICYKALMLASKLAILITSASVTFTMIASHFLNDHQLNNLANTIWYITKIVFYICISLGSFFLGASFAQKKHQIESDHAAVLQAATRRRLSMRSMPSPKSKTPPTTPPTTLSLDTNCDSPPKRRSSRRIRGRSSRLDFDSPMAPVPIERRTSMSDDNVQW